MLNLAFWNVDLDFKFKITGLLAPGRPMETFPSDAPSVHATSNNNIRNIKKHLQKLAITTSKNIEKNY